MISRPIEAIRPIHQRDTVVLDEHRLRDELELYYNSTLQYIKADICNDKRCKEFGARCWACPAGELIRYARRDEERIGELMKALQERENTIAYLRGQVRGLENNIEDYRAKIASLKCTIDAKTSIIATLQGEKKLPLPF